MSQNRYKLPQKLKMRPFTYQEALKNGVSRYGLWKLQQLGEIERVRKGIYQHIDLELSLESQFREAIMQIGRPSSVCLISALDYYSLTELVPSQVWLMVDEPKRSNQKHIKLLRCRKPHWKIGIIKKKGFWITSLERTLIDSLVYKKKVSRTVAIEAIREALTEKQTTLHDLIHMAKRLKVFHLVYPTLETFA